MNKLKKQEINDFTKFKFYSKQQNIKNTNTKDGFKNIDGLKKIIIYIFMFLIIVFVCIDIFNNLNKIKKSPKKDNILETNKEQKLEEKITPKYQTYSKIFLDNIEENLFQTCIIDKAEYEKEKNLVFSNYLKPNVKITVDSTHEAIREISRYNGNLINNVIENSQNRCTKFLEEENKKIEDFLQVEEQIKLAKEKAETRFNELYKEVEDFKWKRSSLEVFYKEIEKEILEFEKALEKENLTEEEINIRKQISEDYIFFLKATKYLDKRHKFNINTVFRTFEKESVNGLISLLKDKDIKSHKKEEKSHKKEEKIVFTILKDIEEKQLKVTIVPEFKEVEKKDELEALKTKSKEVEKKDELEALKTKSKEVEKKDELEALKLEINNLEQKIKEVRNKKEEIKPTSFIVEKAEQEIVEVPKEQPKQEVSNIDIINPKDIDRVINDIKEVYKEACLKEDKKLVIQEINQLLQEGINLLISTNEEETKRLQNGIKEELINSLHNCY